METLIVVGGGLAAAMIALANRTRPSGGGRRIILVEEHHRFGGGVVQPCFVDALPPGGLELLADAIVVEWPGYLVIEMAPGGDPQTRRVERQICVVAPEQVHADVVNWIDPQDLHLMADIGPLSIGSDSVDLGPNRLMGDVVLDLRPPRRNGAPARLDVEFGSHVPEQGPALSLPVLHDASIGAGAGEGLLQYFPMDPRWLVMRRLRLLPALDPGRVLQGPVAQAQAVRHAQFPCDGPGQAIPQPVPSSLLPSEVPGAVALGMALAAVPRLSPSILAATMTALRLAFAEEGSGRAQALALLGEGDQIVPAEALLLAGAL